MTPEQEKRLREMSLDEMSKYSIVSMNALDGRASNGGKVGGIIQGNINKHNGHMNRIQQLSDVVCAGKLGGNKQALNNYTCPNCGDFGNGNAWKGRHFDNCMGKIYQIDVVTNETIAIYCSVKEAINLNNNNWNRQLINNAISGKKKSAYGFIWIRK